MTALKLAGGQAVEAEAVQMFGDRVLVERLPEQTVGTVTAGGIVLPDSAAADHQRLLQGIVRATGPLVSAYVPVGARVLCERFNRVALDEDGTVWVMSEKSVLAVLS